MIIEHYAPDAQRASSLAGAGSWGVAFWRAIKGSSTERNLSVPSVLALPDCYVFHIRSDPLIFACTAQREAPPLLLLEFLSHLSDVVAEYLGKGDGGFSEDGVRDNAALIYQLLDEMIDGGVPSVTEPNALKEAVPPPRLLAKVAHALRLGGKGGGSGSGGSGDASETGFGGGHGSTHDSNASAWQIPWRRPNVRYASNECYVDVVEELDVTIDNNGMLTNVAIFGQVQCSTKLSGVPDLAVRFHNPEVIEECRFHPCVRFLKWSAERCVSFVPPDGAFKLMDYKVTRQQAKQVHRSAVPFYVKPQITYGPTSGRMSIMVGVKSDGTDGVRVPEQVAIRIPLPNAAVVSPSLPPFHCLIHPQHTPLPTHTRREREREVRATDACAPPCSSCLCGIRCDSTRTCPPTAGRFQW